MVGYRGISTGNVKEMHRACIALHAYEPNVPSFVVVRRFPLSISYPMQKDRRFNVAVMKSTSRKINLRCSLYARGRFEKVLVRQVLSFILMDAVDFCE